MKVTDFFALVPESLRARTYIAGGAAVDLAKALDVDIWVLRPRQMPYGESNLEQTVEALHPHLSDLPGLTELTYEYDPTYEESGFCVVANGVYNGKKIQILASDKDTVSDLLNSFDLSVHQVAIASDGEIHKVHTTTEPHEPIYVINMHDEHKTFERGLKLALRYETRLVWPRTNLPAAPALDDVEQGGF